MHRVISSFPYHDGNMCSVFIIQRTHQSMTTDNPKHRPLDPMEQSEESEQELEKQGSKSSRILGLTLIAVVMFATGRLLIKLIFNV
jgi:hypothetical protein